MDKTIEELITQEKIQNIIDTDRDIIEKKRAEITGMEEYKGLYIHSEHHIKNVVEFAYIIAKTEGILSDEQIQLLLQAAKYHDSGRGHSELPTIIAESSMKHANASAEHAEKVLQGKYSDREIAMIKIAIRYHEHNEQGRNTFDEKFFEELAREEQLKKFDFEQVKLMCIYLKDADALDIGRLDTECDVRYLRTTTSHLMLEYAKERNIDFNMADTIIQAVKDIEEKAISDGNIVLLNKIRNTRERYPSNIKRVLKEIRDYYRTKDKPIAVITRESLEDGIGQEDISKADNKEKAFEKNTEEKAVEHNE